jgi:hypothetical protein
MKHRCGNDDGSQRNPMDDLLHPPHVSQRCGANARSTGHPCRRWAAVGSHRCKLHGGAKGSGRPPIHGRRSAQRQRNQAVTGALMRLVRQRYKKLRPILVPWPEDCDNEGVTPEAQGGELGEVLSPVGRPSRAGSPSVNGSTPELPGRQ